MNWKKVENYRKNTRVSNIDSQWAKTPNSTHVIVKREKKWLESGARGVARSPFKLRHIKPVTLPTINFD